MEFAGLFDQLLLGGIAENAHERRVYLQKLSADRGAIDAVGGVFNQFAIAHLGMLQSLFRAHLLYSCGQEVHDCLQKLHFVREEAALSLRVRRENPKRMLGAGNRDGDAADDVPLRKQRRLKTRLETQVLDNDRAAAQQRVSCTENRCRH